jgi:chemotaxis protein methyltransferase CheR
MINSRIFSKNIGLQASKKIKLSQDEFFFIRDYIYEKSGILIKENKKDFLESRLLGRVEYNKFETVKDYYYYLKYNNSEKEFKCLMDSITINETKFFRNIPLLNAFRTLMKDEFSNSRTKEIKILSAGCSTGEEPYTLAMILSELNLKYKITAGDISQVALKSAQNGLYKETQLRSTENLYRQKYFKKDGNMYRVDRSLTKSINFTYVNLSESVKLKQLGKFDVIFCRNVMIYFDSEFKKKLVKIFYDMLNNNSYFFIGHSESLFGINSDFKTRLIDKTIAYRKEVK